MILLPSCLTDMSTKFYAHIVCIRASSYAYLYLRHSIFCTVVRNFFHLISLCGSNREKEDEPE